MTTRTRITAVARARGSTAAAVARRLGLYPSNISAMDAGTRAVSLRALARIAQVLDCGVADLIETDRGTNQPLFQQRGLSDRLRARELAVVEGAERGWMHSVMLAWQRHYHRPEGGRRRVRG